ncbi:MAG: KamA family radical SAM protein [Methanomassiliicoccales archaeon]|nr:KamA family radical SAM protein [Methanomassiliicoccales archaeon]
MIGKPTSSKRPATKNKQKGGGHSTGREVCNSVLWNADQEFHSALTNSSSVQGVREGVRRLLLRREKAFHDWDCSVDALERANAINCIRVMRNFISPRNERLSGVSVVEHIYELSRSDQDLVGHPAFLYDLAYILLGTKAESGIYLDEAPDFLGVDEVAGAMIRSDYLDDMAHAAEVWMARYPTGLLPEVKARRQFNRERIMDYLNASTDDWQDYVWQIRHVMMDAGVIGDMVQLTEEEHEAIRLCSMHQIPFGITPYYLSLMDPEPTREFDHAVRAQVIPPLSYVKGMLDSRKSSTTSLDFMLEGQTSPVELVTRRYPMIAIFKPYNTCAQICVYCQRNWEIDGVLSPDAMASQEKIDKAIEWFQEHPSVSEVLVTGGDPAVLSNGALRKLMRRLAEMPHIRRVRMGTRTPVVLPMRVDQGFLDIISEVHDPPHREFALVTHFEHTYEITPESADCIRSLRKIGISVYNQQVFTMENARRFETVALRQGLKSIGVDPYYTFNAKGKEETSSYRVPISRLLQERKEEARLIPGLSRTDEPVFNIPGLGKNHLRAWQHHDLISLTPRGERVYEFHPWEKNIAIASTYVHQDVPILDFLGSLADRGEDVEEYRSIWYYF